MAQRYKADINDKVFLAGTVLPWNVTVAHQSLNEGRVVADQSLNEGPVADQLSEHDTYSKTRVQTTHLLRLMRLQLKCTVYV